MSIQICSEIIKYKLLSFIKNVIMDSNLHFFQNIFIDIFTHWKIKLIYLSFIYKHSILLNNCISRKQNCPQCRATVLEKDLIKLYLEDHPNAQIQLNNKNVQDLNSLK